MDDAASDLGKLLLRLLVGGLILLHGIHKLTHGLDGITVMVESRHLPAWAAYGVYLGEVAGPVLVLLGLFARAGALLIVINMSVAVWLVHMDWLTALNPNGGWKLELEAFYLVTALAVMLLGAGGISLGGRDGTLN